MLRHVVLLTGLVEQPFLTALLRQFNPGLSVRPVASLAELQELHPLFLRSARLVAFCTGTVVPGRVLDQLAFGAYNFHPGSPRFPGARSARRAIREDVHEFGATAHVMVKKIDAGPIVGVELFQIPSGSTVNDLEQLTYVHMLWLFRRLAQPLACQIEPLAILPIRWERSVGIRSKRAGRMTDPRGKEAMLEIAAKHDQRSTPQTRV
jgi:methionyl-tRNA formyltransferase